MIPKRFHAVWIGDSELPDFQQEWIYSWIRNHSDWDFTLWATHPAKHKDGPYKSISLISEILNKEAYERIGELVGLRPMIAAQSDILRYEIVAQHGGVYLDTDVECFQPIDDLLDGVDLFLCDEYGTSDGNYMFGARRNHPALWKAVAQLHRDVAAASIKARESRKTIGAYDYISPVELTGPLFLNRIVRPHPDCVVFPCSLFNPLSPHVEGRNVKRWPASARANHHYSGTWYSRTKSAPPVDMLTPVDGQDEPELRQWSKKG